MAQFVMNAQISLKANNAIKAIQKFNKETKESKKEFSILGRTISLDTKRMAKNLGAMALIAGGFFAKVISQSPHLRVEFKRLAASTLLFNVALGEKLQPTVATMVDWMISLQDKFLALPDSIQEVILITGILTGALTLATLAALGLWTALGPITLTILGISIAVALMITYWDEFVWGIKFGWEVTKIVLGLFLKGIIWLGQEIWKIIQNIIFWFGDLGRAIIFTFGDMGRAIWDGIVDIKNWFGDLGSSIVDIWDDAMKGAGAQWDAFKDSIMDGINWIIDGLEGLFTSISDFFTDIFDTILSGFGTVMGALGLGGGDNEEAAMRIYEDVTGTTITPEQREEMFGGAAEGRDINQDGLIFAHRDERITTKSEARANRRQRGEGANGNTYNYYNTYKIGSVDSKKRIRELLQAVERSSKRSNDRRLKI